MGLYQKYRPQSLEEVKGNRQILATLQTMVSDKKTCPHAFMLTGQTGCGKTTIGRIIVDMLDCKGSDFREVNSADFRGIDTIRDIIKNSQYKPIESSCRVWLIDEVQKMTGDAQSALLKILEDAPAHIYFILCTTDPQKVLPTVKNRCSIFQVELLSEIDMLSLLKKVAKAEGQKLNKEVLDQIVISAQGHPRNALQILEQVLNTDEENQLAIAQKSIEIQTQAIELCRALLGNKRWKEIAKILNGLKEAKEDDAEGIRRMVLGYCQAILLKGENDKAAGVMECFLEPNFTNGFPQLVFSCYSAIQDNEN